MLKTIISFCLSRRAIVVFGLLLFAAAGIIAFRNLDIEAYPNPSPVVLEITAQSPGLSAREMERYYTIPIENGLYTVPGINVIRSTSFYGLSFVRVAFNYGVNYDFAYAQTVIALQQNVNLPGGVTANVQQNSGTGEIMRYEVIGPPHFGVTNLRTVQDWIVRRRLLQVHGIVAVNSWGGPTKEFEVDVDPRKLREYGLTVPQVISALGNSNINVGAREITIGQQSVNIRGVGLIDDGGDESIAQGYKVADIENVVLSQQGGVPVLIKDVATVKVGYRPRLGIAGRDQEDDIVFGIVVMGRTYQTDHVLPQVEAAVHKMNQDGSLPAGVKVVPFYDRNELMGLTTHTVMHNLVFGCLLVFLIQWVFLGDLRSAVIVGLTIPFALLLAVIILVARGESANLLSLGAVDFGIIVDSAVIVMENIFRNLQRPAEQRQSLLERLAAGAWGRDPTQAAADQAAPVRGWTDRLRLILISVTQVDRAVLFSVLIIVAAFVPLFTMEGVEGAIFGPMARTYAYALFGALICTFTVTPVLASIFLPARVEESETLIVRGLHRAYDAALRFALAHRSIVIGSGLVFLAVAVFCWTRLGSEFLPHLDEGNLWIRAELPMTMSLEDGTAAARTMRLILLQYPEVDTVVSQHGRPDDGSDASPFSNVELNVPLKPPSGWPKGVSKDQLIDDIQAKFQSALPGVTFNFSQYIQDNIEEAMSGVKGENSVKIIGPSLETLTTLATQVRNEMAKVRGITDLGIFPVLGQADLDITVNRAAAARYGLNTGDVNTVIQAALGGAVATEVLEGDRQFDLVVRYPRIDRDSVEKIRNLEVAYQAGNGPGYVPLNDLAGVNLTTGAAWIYHEGGERFIPVKFSVRGRDLGGAVGEAQSRIASQVKLPPGYRLEWSGEYGELQAAQQRLEVIVPVSLVLILGLLYSLFNSIKESLLSLTGIPFAVAGGVLGLYLTGRDFSISAAIGFISLFGVSVMIGILLLNRFNRARRRGLAPPEAMFEAASGLMRPLLMMSLAAGIGLLPAALSTGIGSEVQRPLATVVVGGMLFGTFLLLLVVPVLTMVLLGRGNVPAGRP